MVYDNTKLQLEFSRIEHKYLLLPTIAERLKKYLSRFAEMDIANKKNNNQAYFVKSIYFDSPTLTFAQEKIEGCSDRIKIRVRTYAEDENNTNLFLEIKGKKGERIYKQRERITFLELQSLMRCDLEFLLAKEEDFFKRVWFWFSYYHLSPKVKNSYERISFVDHLVNCKVSFDSELRANAVNAQSFLQKTPLNGMVVMEVKFDKHLPKYLAEMISQNELKRVSVSKYLLSVQAINNKFLTIINN